MSTKKPHKPHRMLKIKNKKLIVAQKPRKRLPVSIITGFLGSGKTTLVNNILQNKKKWKIAIIVNEFGEVGIDNQLMMSTKEDIIELSNGCICCQVRGDLIETVLKILKKYKNLDYLIIETSGVANPIPVAQTFFLKDLQPVIEMDSIITVVDTLHFKQNMKKSNAKDQIKAGDIILVNKVDLVKKKEITAVKKAIKKIAPHARIVETTKSNIPLQLILNIGQFDIKRFLDEKGNWKEEDHEHDAFGNHIDEDGVISFMFKTTKPIDMHKFQRFAQHLPESICRSKGIIYFKGIKNKAIYQHVGRRIDVKTDKIWGKEKKQTQLVFIGQDFDPNEIKKQLKKCLE
jgi:G3E family GTPase